MDEFTLIEKYFKKLTYKNPSALDLNDDVFFDKKNNVVISIDTYVDGVHFVNFPLVPLEYGYCSSVLI